MSATPIQAALAFYDALNRDDREMALDLTHPDYELVSIAAESLGVAVIEGGHAGLRKFWQRLDEHGRSARLVVRESREVAGRAVCMLAVSNELEGDPGLASVVWSVVSVDDDGIITSIWGFRTEREAVAAAESGKPA